MAVFGRGIYKCFGQQHGIAWSVLRKLKCQNVSFRTAYTARVLGDITDPNPNNYEYEVSNDENEWKYVERLLPMKEIPQVTPKDEYPSGWRPQTAEAHTHPYFVERSRNHMLPVYLQLRQRGMRKQTKIANVHGDIWLLHNELKEKLETQLDKIIFSFVHEGNCQIMFKGDFVHYCEQFLLEKGF